MLATLSIRNIVLIHELDLEFGSGLWALTGETGAGKSILLDSLGLALGARADRSILRQGSSQGSVTAEFVVSNKHAAITEMAELGLHTDGNIILRRHVKDDGKTRAWINDQSVSVSTLRRVGVLLMEIHGQNDERGLLDPSSHRRFLDAFGGYDVDLGRCRRAFERFQDIDEELEKAEAAFRSRGDESKYLEHVLAELAELDPKAGEEDELTAARVSMMNAEQISEDLVAAGKIMSGQDGVETQMATVARLLARTTPKGPRVMQELAELVDKSLSDIAEIARALSLLESHVKYDENELNRIEERLFALRAAARKFKATPETLPAIVEKVRTQLQALQTDDDRLVDLRARHSESQEAYSKAAGLLSKKRHKAAKRFDRSIQAELAPLKLAKASFSTQIETYNSADRKKWSKEGLDRVEFEVSTNPGAAPGPLTQIASGGEFARFILAMKVVQAAKAEVGSLIFDEVDQGIGGAVADAVGERLAVISERQQVLVVTHSPQVASRASAQLLVEKELSGEVSPSVAVRTLTMDERTEEIARMLSGARITDAARKAAISLLSGGASNVRTGTRG